MSFDLSSITSGGEPRGPVILVHGTPGIGKTTLAAGADRPIFIRTEDGLGSIDVPTFPQLVKTYGEMMQAIVSLFGDHNYKTVVIDSLTAFEGMVGDEVARSEGVASIEKVPWGSGYKLADKVWSEFLAALHGLALKRGMTVVLIAHSDTVRVKPPSGDDYTQHTISLHERSAKIVLREMDIVAFAHIPVHVQKEPGSKAAVGKAVARGGHTLQMHQDPVTVAKSRYHLDKSIPMTWEALVAPIPFLNQTNQNEQ